MPVYGLALIKSFLVYKGTMTENMANQQGALSDPKAACNPAKEEIVDIEYELLDAESDSVTLSMRVVTLSMTFCRWICCLR